MASPDNMNCTIKKKPGAYNCYTMTFKGITRGGILAMLNALRSHAEHSAVGKDLFDFMKCGVEENGEPELKNLLS